MVVELGVGTGGFVGSCHCLATGDEVATHSVWLCKRTQGCAGKAGRAQCDHMP